jgi:hypothetical protein
MLINQIHGFGTCLSVQLKRFSNELLNNYQLVKICADQNLPYFLRSDKISGINKLNR